MAKSQNLQTSFASGELSPLLLGRTDLEQYYKGAQTAEGVVIVPQGGVKRRPGTQHIDAVLRGNIRQTAVNPTMPNGGTAANLNDGDASTYAQTDASVSASPYVVAEYDLGASYDANWVTIENAHLIRNGTGGEEVKTANLFLQRKVSGTYTTYKTIAITSEFGGLVSEKFDISGLTLADKREWRITTDLGNTADWRVRIGEFNFSAQPTGYDATSNVKTFDWDYSAEIKFLVVITDSNARFYRIPHSGSTDTVYVADIPVPYTSAQIPTIRDAQTENVMLLFHEDQKPRRIIFDPTTFATTPEDAFVADEIPFQNVPQYDYNDSSSPTPTSAVQVATFAHFVAGNTYQLDVEGILSKNITFAGDSGVEQDSTAENLRKGLQDMPNFGDSGISVERTAANTYTITFAGESAKPLDLLAGFPTGSNNVHSSAAIGFSQTTVGVSRSEPVWSVTRGFPGIGVFYDGRLWLGAAKSKPQSLFASRAGNFFDFFSEQGDDDEGIFITIDSRGSTNIVDINPDRGLQVFCSGSEFVVKGSTPATIVVDAQTQHGSFNLEAKSIDGATLFVDKNGNTLRQFVYNFNEDAYVSTDISVLSTQLIDRPKDMAILAGTTSDDANWVFIINNDGTAAVLNTLRAQDINGFTKWTPYDDPGSVRQNVLESCSVVGDELYLIVKRVFPSGVRRDIERWNFDYLLESSVKTTVTAPSPVADVFVVIPDGIRLSGYTVGVLADGNVLADRAVTTSGSDYGITITAAELTGFTTRNLEIGLNFPVKVKPMPLNTAGPGGMNTMKRKKIVRMNVRVYESAGIQIDGNDVPVRKLGESEDSPLNTPYTPRTGIIQDDNGGNGWDTEVVPEINVPKGTPFHLQAIGYEVESS